jgi:hypothetical protein
LGNNSVITLIDTPDLLSTPHDVPHEQALILAANHQRVLGHQAEVRVL